MKTIILFFFLTLTIFAQSYPVNQDMKMYKGDYTILSFNHTRDISADSVLFVVKADRQDSTDGVIQRKNTGAGGDDNQIQIIGNTILVKLLVSNTEGLTAATYVYDLVDDSTTIFTGYLTLIDEVTGSADGVPTRTPYYTVALDTPIANNVFPVGMDSNNVWYQKTVPQVQTILGIDTLSGGIIVDLDSLYTKTSHIVTPEMFGAVGDSITDCYTAFDDAVNSLFDNNGGELTIPAGYYVINSLWELPRSLTAVGDNPYSGKPIKITGAGAYMSGRTVGTVPIGGTVLILNYSGDEGYKIFSQGNANVEISGITFYSPGADSNVFILSTNTNLQIHNCSFWGARTGTSANQDAIILGGTYTGNPARGDSSGFQGYGTVIRDNYFNKIRRAVYGRAFANSVVVSDNNLWNSCGSNLENGAAIEFDGLNALPVVNNDAGGSISGNLIEMGGYPYAIKLKNASQFSVIGNNFYDQSSTTLGYYYLDTSAVYNYIQRGYHGDIKPMFVEIETGTNTFVDFGASQYTYWSQRMSFGSIVRFTNTNPIYWVNSNDMTQNFNLSFSFSSQPIWYLDYVDTTGSSETLLIVRRADATHHYLEMLGADTRIVSSDASSDLRLYQGSGGDLWLGVAGNLRVSSLGRLTSTITTGTSPFNITSTTPVDNLTVKRIFDPSFLGDTQTDLDMNSKEITAIKKINAPGTPSDTSNTNAGDYIYDLNTGQVSIVIGENLVANGDFTDWTGSAKSALPDNWLFTPARDTTLFYVEQSPTGEAHVIHDGTIIAFYQTSVFSVGVTYGYSFEITDINDTMEVSWGGVNIAYTSTGIYTGEFTALSGDLSVATFRAGSAADITIDNIRAWQKIGGNKQAPVYIHNLPYVSNWTNQTLDDTLSLFLTDKALQIDSIKFRVDDSTGVKMTFGSLGLGTTILESDTLTSGWTTITSFNDNTIDADNEVYLYFTYIGDTATFIRWKIYWRE
jgi:hypothetical protein